MWGRNLVISKSPGTKPMVSFILNQRLFRLEEMASTALEPHSCVYRQKIVLHRGSVDPKTSPPSRAKTVMFDFSLFDLKEAAAQHCLFCNMLLGEFDASLVGQLDPPQDLFLCAKITPSAILSEDSINNFSLWNKKAASHVAVAAPRRYSIFAIPDDPASKEILTRPINYNPASATSWELARHWINDCKTNHPECTSPIPTTLPTRVVEISKDGPSWRAQLKCDNQDQNEPYAALSYCWGPSQSSSLRTTMENIDSMASNIPWNLFPKTMQDAIITTHQLGLHFLWIDALSIIQDDEEDKAQQISQMPLIYGQATVVIAASRATEATEGFLHERIATHEKAFQLPYRCATGATGDLGSVVMIDRSDRDQKMQPLDKRAWAFQERLLAPRVLDYSDSQTRWTCRHENWKLPLADGWWTHEIRLHLTLNDRLHPSNLTTELVRKEISASLRYDWASCVAEYKTRDLTIQSDKILAISGIAKLYANALGDRYLAGLWESSLPDALLWYVQAVEKRLPRPRKYQGPSWSWVSVNGKINAWSHSILDGVDAVTELQIVNAHIPLSSSDAPFGALVHGALTVNGRLKSAEWKANSPYEERNSCLRTLHSDGSHRVLALRMFPDAYEPDFDDNQWVPVFILLVMSDQYPDDPEHPDCWCIVLRPRGGDTYSRLGYFHYWFGATSTRLPNKSKESWTSSLFDACEPQTITIV